MRCVEARSTGGPLAPDLRITLNFHPDRIVGGSPILDCMLNDGLCHSQFVTGTGNGGRTAFPGGDRWWWEHHMFGGAYDDAASNDPPKYGALDLARRPVGAAPRFGSAHFRLNAATSRRATFCYPDSHPAPAASGWHSAPGRSWGLPPVHDPGAIRWTSTSRPRCTARSGSTSTSRRWSWIRVSAAPSWRRRQFPCPIKWHGGFRVTVDELRRYPSYRGTRFLESALAAAVDGVLDPHRLGAPDRATDPEVERS